MDCCNSRCVNIFRCGYRSEETMERSRNKRPFYFLVFPTPYKVPPPSFICSHSSWPPPNLPGENQTHQWINVRNMKMPISNSAFSPITYIGSLLAIVLSIISISQTPLPKFCGVQLSLRIIILL